MSESYLTQAAADLCEYGPSMSLSAMRDALAGIVAHLTDPLTVERDRAREVAVAFEGLVAAALDLHARADYGIGTPHAGSLCRECGQVWPCATGRALGVDVLTDDELLDLTDEVTA